MTTAESDGSASPAFRLMYRSHSRIPGQKRKTELGDIFSVARANNKKQGITGALLVVDNWFVQVIEGEETAVRGLYDRICRDPRHERISLLSAEVAPGRTFGRWAMAQVSDGGEPDIPLITNIDKGGIVPAAPRSITPEQKSLLSVMRGVLHEAAESSGSAGD